MNYLHRIDQLRRAELFKRAAEFAAIYKPELPTIVILPGGMGSRLQRAFEPFLQLRQFTVGAGSSVRGTQVLDSPFFEHSPPDKAEIRFLQRDPHSLLVAIRHPGWFEPYAQTTTAPMELIVPVKAFSLRPLFPRGPTGGP